MRARVVSHTPAHPSDHFSPLVSPPYLYYFKINSVVVVVTPTLTDTPIVHRPIARSNGSYLLSLPPHIAASSARVSALSVAPSALSSSTPRSTPHAPQAHSLPPSVAPPQPPPHLPSALSPFNAAASLLPPSNDAPRRYRRRRIHNPRHASSSSVTPGDGSRMRGRCLLTPP